MAYLREEKKKSGTYIRIVESIRENGKPVQRTLLNLGKAEDYTPTQLKRIGARLYRLGGGNVNDLVGNSVSEIARFNYGFYQVYSKYLKLFDLDAYFRKISKDKKLSYDLSKSILLMILERLNDPCSKLASFHNQHEYIGLPSIDLHKLYRSLDFLCDASDSIQDIIYRYDRNLFNQSIDLVFYDVTTFYFDSTKEDDLRRKGFGKDGKIGKTQIVFGLMIDKEQRPIAYQIYDGKFYEGHTFSDAVKKIKNRFNIDKVIIVADRGMMSRANIKEVESFTGFEYIVGERLKSLPTDISKNLIDLSSYKNEWIYDKNGEEIKLNYTTIDYNNKKIICTYSAKRAKKDRMEREEKIEKAKAFIATPSKLRGKERIYYLKTEEKKYSLDEKKIAESSKFDGFIAIATNNRDLSEVEILDNYRHLYRVEHSFRKFKSHLETRPMFHWTESRIKGHLCLCYIAYALNNQVLLDLKKGSSALTENTLREALSKMQLSLVEQNKEQYYIRSALNENEHKLIKTLKLSKIPNLTPKSKLINYLG